MSQGKAFLAVYQNWLQIITEQKLIEANRDCFHIVGGHVGVEMAQVSEDKLTRGGQFRESEYRHRSCSDWGEPDKDHSIASRILSSIGRKSTQHVLPYSGQLLDNSLSGGSTFHEEIVSIILTSGLSSLSKSA